ncbi:MAG: ABC transporter ATP-binding protein [Actinomycetia bacterium]|nr:ABC transporter ATP-binding protein [Actinomycetes bacterium]
MSVPPAGGLEARIRIARGPEFTLDIDLTIEAGSTAALLGPNGAGKSTTIEIIAGLLPVDGGCVRLGERVLDDPEEGCFVAPEQRHVGIVFQRYLLFEHLTVAANIAFGVTHGRWWGSRQDRVRASVDQWMESLELTELAGRHPSELSGGQAQRVALARALATEPDLLLLDEPLAALDVETKAQMRRTLADHLSSYPGPRLIITHDPADAFLLGDRIHVLEAGRLTQSGSAESIRRRPATAYAAALAGTNLLTGSNDGGNLRLDHHRHTLQSSDTHTVGPVLITIHPTAIALHPDEPHGSPRNTWSTTVATVEPLGDTTRITLDQPLPLGVDITPAATSALGLAPGSKVWVSIKATEISVEKAG